MELLLSLLLPFPLNALGMRGGEGLPRGSTLLPHLPRVDFLMQLRQPGPGAMEFSQVTGAVCEDPSHVTL
jgi:hypothetical protein